MAPLRRLPTTATTERDARGTSTGIQLGAVVVGAAAGGVACQSGRTIIIFWSGTPCCRSSLAVPAGPFQRGDDQHVVLARWRVR